MNSQKTNNLVTERVIGLDSHPDSFTAAIVRGPTPAQAVTEKLFHKVPLAQLQHWAQKYSTPADLFLLEASGNSFQIVRSLAKVERQAVVLESKQLGKLKEAHANNDKISAVRIAKAYLAGTAKTVWVPDQKTQERRDWFHAYEKVSRRGVQVHNRLLSYLSDNGVRLAPGTDLVADGADDRLRKAREWAPRQWQVVEGLLLELRHSDTQRAHWRSLMAQEVATDPELLSLVRLCGVRDLVAFATGAIIGDIHRFASPDSLVNYLGLCPSFDDSGQEEWRGGVGKNKGRRDLRSLLIESAQSVLRSHHPLAAWGRKILRKTGCEGVAVVAIARKLAVAIWYLLMGRWAEVETIDEPLAVKVGKIITRVGPKGLKELGQTRKTLRQQMYESLRKGRTYVLEPDKQFVPKDSGATASPPPSPTGRGTAAAQPPPKKTSAPAKAKK